MGAVHYLVDKLVNAVSGTGTARDQRSASFYTARPLTQHEIASAYSGSGLMRKIVGIPALDMVREWRDPSGLDDDQAAALWDEEKRHAIRQKVRQAEVLRGMGGGAFVLGLPGNPSEPAPTSISKGGLAFIHVVSRWHLVFDALSDDATQSGYGEPTLWKMQTTEGQQSIHPSRVIPFRADTSASLAMPGVWGGMDAFWGESTVQQVLDAVKDSDTARAAFAALINKARLLRLGIPGLMDLASTPGGEAKIQTRLGAVVLAESIHNATIYDAGDREGKGGEEIKDATYNFAGAKDVLNAYAEFVAAISDIPATRLLGRAPEGLNSSGDSQQQDWRKKIRAMQTLELAPCLDRLDRYLVPSAIGSTPPTYAYDFAPLDTPGEKERAETFKVAAEAVEKVANLGTVPERALARGVQSWLVAEGYLPELEAALSEMSDEERYGIMPELGEQEGGGLDLKGGAVGEEEPPLRRAANDAIQQEARDVAVKVVREAAPVLIDAVPRPLYVRRQLLNAADLVKWAKDNGFEETLPAGDMHVTVLYSKQPVDPIKMGEAWGTEQNGDLIVKAGGPRALERFNEGAVVLQFASSNLAYRHEDMVRNGANHDWPEYLPHVTITYAGADLDLSRIKPYAGELHFGPEIFEAIDEDWKSKIEEE